MHLALTLTMALMGAAIAAAGLFVMSRGLTTTGLFAFGIGVVLLVSTLGAGLPKPFAVPRPGEEDAYEVD